jgi:hypothetical protein
VSARRSPQRHTARRTGTRFWLDAVPLVSDRVAAGRCTRTTVRRIACPITRPIVWLTPRPKRPVRGRGLHFLAIRATHAAGASAGKHATASMFRRPHASAGHSARRGHPAPRPRRTADSRSASRIRRHLRPSRSGRADGRRGQRMVHAGAELGAVSRASAMYGTHLLVAVIVNARAAASGTVSVPCRTATVQRHAGRPRQDPTGRHYAALGSRY